MMKQSACRQLTEPGFWAGVLVVLCTLSMGADVHQDLKTQSMPSRVLKRHKRDWNWDKLYVSEELPPQNPPGKIGKLKRRKVSSHPSGVCGEVFLQKWRRQKAAEAGLFPDNTVVLRHAQGLTSLTL